MRPRFLGLIAGITVGATVYAAAATLGGLTVHNLGAGSAPVQSCDTGASASYTLGTENNVIEVAIGDLAAECTNGQLHLTLTGAGGTSLGSGGATVTGTSVTVAISPTPFAGDVTGIHVAITGP